MENQAMREVTYEETLFDIEDAILNEEYTGFKEDYLILHSLIRRYNPKTIMETGTNLGRGTMIMINAAPEADVFSIDLPNDMTHLSKQAPIRESHGMKVASLADKNLYTQLFGNTLEFDYSKYPCEFWFIDSEHTTKVAQHEAEQAIKQDAKVIAFHDADMPEVYEGIINAFKNTDYQLFRVLKTRILYAAHV